MGASRLQDSTMKHCWRHHVASLGGGSGYSTPLGLENCSFINYSVEQYWLIQRPFVNKGEVSNHCSLCSCLFLQPALYVGNDSAGVSNIFFNNAKCTKNAGHCETINCLQNDNCNVLSEPVDVVNTACASSVMHLDVEYNTAREGKVL